MWSTRTPSLGRTLAYVLIDKVTKKKGLERLFELSLERFNLMRTYQQKPNNRTCLKSISHLYNLVRHGSEVWCMHVLRLPSLLTSTNSQLALHFHQLLAICFRLCTVSTICPFMFTPTFQSSFSMRFKPDFASLAFVLHSVK